MPGSGQGKPCPYRIFSPAGADHRVTWTVASGPGAITAAGRFTSTAEGEAMVRATSVANPAVSAVAAVTVTRQPQPQLQQPQAGGVGAEQALIKMVRDNPVSSGLFFGLFILGITAAVLFKKKIM